MRGLGSGVQGLGRVVGARVGTKGRSRSGVRAQGCLRPVAGPGTSWVQLRCGGRGAQGLGAESGGGGGWVGPGAVTADPVRIPGRVRTLGVPGSWGMG